MHTDSPNQLSQIALLGNPNSGKTSLFNILTGANQRVGNFPGVTVEKKSGSIKLQGLKQRVKLIDFPGTYSLYPNSTDERIVAEQLANPSSKTYPDAIIYVLDTTQIEKQSLLLSQVLDLGIPTLLVLNMADLLEEKGIKLDTKKLSEHWGIPLVKISTRSKEGIAECKRQITRLNSDIQSFVPKKKSYKAFNSSETKVITDIKEKYQTTSDYQALLLAHHTDWFSFLTENEKAAINASKTKHEFRSLDFQINETMGRFDGFASTLKRVAAQKNQAPNFSNKLDRYLTHPILGPILSILLLLFIFQAIYEWSALPMDWIDAGVGSFSTWVGEVLPSGWFSDLMTNGVIAGLGGIVIFVPQIAILFLLIGIFEEVGYMARVAYIWDRTMQFFGLNGRSIVSLVSGGACAIPAIMSARTITNSKERLITILSTPFISCAARIPVYTVLIGFVVPASAKWWIFNVQGLAFMGLYLLGIVGAFGMALFFKYILKSEEKSYLTLELPEYRVPVWRNLLFNVWEKVKSFLLEAGKVIFVISIVLWIAASYGPSAKMEAAQAEATEISQIQNLDEAATENLIASKTLEASYAGQFGKLLEPAIKPLGYDWKMGIALLTSFGAREVFVGTMATIYSIGSEADELSVRQQMAQEINPLTGKKTYNLATALSLLIFYVFALQCMSTLAIMKKETGGWKYPILLFFLALGVAYLGAFAVYQGFS